MSQADRDRATIEALKLALEQAATHVEILRTQIHPGAIHGGFDAVVARFRAMSAPDWEALPVELTGPGGDA